MGNSIDYEEAKDDVEVINLELSHLCQKTTLAREATDFEIRTKELELTPRST